MFHILQVMNYMLTRLEYNETEIEVVFDSIEKGDYSVEELLNNVGLEFSNEFQVDRMKECIPKWRSALHVAKMRLEP